MRPADIASFDEEDADLEAETDEEGGAEETNGEGEADGNGDSRRRKRRRRRRSHNGDREGSGIAANAPQPSDDGLAVIVAETGAYPPPVNGADYEAGDEDHAGDAEPGAAPSAEGRRRRSRRRGRGGRDFAPNGEKIHISEAGAGESQAADEASFEGQEELFSAEPVSVEPVAAEPLSSPEHVAVGDVREAEKAVAETAVAVEPAAPQRAAPAPAPVVVEDDPNRPKRTGWWQRAKASLGG